MTLNDYWIDIWPEGWIDIKEIWPPHWTKIRVKFEDETEGEWMRYPCEGLYWIALDRSGGKMKPTHWKFLTREKNDLD